MKLHWAGCALVVLGLAVGEASASLFGTELTVERKFFSSTPESETFTVPGDGSIAVSLDFLDIRFPDGETIDITAPSNLGGPNFTLVFSGLDWGAIDGEVVGVTADFVDPSFFDQVSLMTDFTADSVTVIVGAGVSGDSIDGGGTVRLLLDVTHVPEPGTGAVVLLGVGVLGVVIRRVGV